MFQKQTFRQALRKKAVWRILFSEYSADVAEWLRYFQLN
jgi:hypothetical protein